MSLVFRACPTVRIGVTSSRLPLSGNFLRAFQTLSAPKTSTRDDNEIKSPHVASLVLRQWKPTSPIQSATTLQYSSFSVIAKLSSSPWYQTTPNSATQTARSMASEPESHVDGKPTLEYVKKMPKTFASMTNYQILHFAEVGIPEACRECIVRDIMAVDHVEYDDAMEAFKEIAKTNREGMHVASFPFYLGLGVSVTGAYASIPLVFHLGTVKWFNEVFVTSELPPPADLETWLEVGAASWSWMEPLLGHVSFFLLCMTFARAQMQNLGIRPYFNWQQERQAAKLIKTYPKYDPEFLANYSNCDRLVEPHKMND